MIIVFAASLGWAAALLAAVVALPQVLRLVRTGSVAGVSVAAWRLTLIGNVAWTAHGVLTQHLNMIVPNVAFGILTSVVLMLLSRARGISPFALFVPSIVAGLLCAVVDVTFGPVAFAVVAGTPSVVAWLTQLRELVVAPRINGFSLPYVVLNTINQVMWLGWAMLVGDPSVIICATTFGLLMTANLGYALLRRQGVVKARLAVMWA